MGAKERFFTPQQKVEHAKTVGWQCEFYVDKGQRCPEDGYLEADHVQPVSKGGETEEENLELLCPEHHAVKHQLDEEPWAVRLIRSRTGGGKKR